jgi:glycosyltransferase involved in cell wall biosynthesis
MRILHYSLGVYPQRMGGLSKYVTDLANLQSKYGDDVSIVYPGRVTKNQKNIKFKLHRKSINVKVIEIINPLPVSIFNGIRPKDVKYYIEKTNEKDYEKLFELIKPDVINIHTMMGLHQEFLEVARKMKIKLIYSAHDFFGLCPITTLYKIDKTCNYKTIGNHCFECNLNAKSLSHIKTQQSLLYLFLKKFSIFRKIYTLLDKILKKSKKMPSLKFPQMGKIPKG